MNSRTKALAIAKAASNKKALDIVIINMRDIPSVTDYFVITSGASSTQVKAIADNIVKKLHQVKQRVGHIEGERDASWILLDYGDVVAHVFYEDTRRFYNLEHLWGDAPQEKFEDMGKVRKSYHAKKRRKNP